MRGDLPEPDAELARKVFAEVDFEQRLVLFHRGRNGVVTITIYTMWEILGFLELPRPDVDFDKLAWWLESAVEDHHLAFALREVAATDDGPEKKCDRAKYLIALRLRQCRSKLG